MDAPTRLLGAPNAVIHPTREGHRKLPFGYDVGYWVGTRTGSLVAGPPPLVTYIEGLGEFRAQFLSRNRDTDRLIWQVRTAMFPVGHVDINGSGHSTRLVAGRPSARQTGSAGVVIATPGFRKRQGEHGANRYPPQATSAVMMW